MTSPTKRQPLPAIVCLVALCLLTALVWWRVLGRDDDAAGKQNGCSTASPEHKTLPEPQAVTLSAVLNSTTRNGLAGKVNTQLRKIGFQTPADAGNDPAKTKVAGVAEIRYTPDRAQDATLLEYYLPGAKLVKLTPDNSTADGGELDVSLGAKFAKLATSAQVSAALKKDGVTLTKTISGDSATDSCAPSPTTAG